MDNELQKKIADEYARLIVGQREEIMQAFLAKYGFEPGDNVMQFNYGNRWGVVKTDEIEYAGVRAEVIKSNAAKEIVTLIRDIVVAMRYDQGDQHRDATWEYSPVDTSGELKKLTELLGLVFNPDSQRYEHPPDPSIITP